MVMLVRAQFTPVTALAKNMRTEGQLEWVKLLDIHADTKGIDESHSPLEAAGTPLHSCTYISGAMLDGGVSWCK